MLGKNTIQVMIGVVGGVIVAEYVLKKTPVGQMLGLTA